VAEADACAEPGKPKVTWDSALLPGAPLDVRVAVSVVVPSPLSVAVIVFAILRKWLPLDTGGVFIAALVILCGAWLGNELRYGGRMIEPLVENHQVGGWIGTMFNAANQLGGYLKDYEVNLFFASLAVGGYLGWRGHRLLQRVDDARKVPENSPTLKVPRERRKQDKRQAA